MVHFTKEQISDIITRYQNGETLNSIGEDYSVSRPTIQKIVKGNYPEYTGKKRALKAVEGQTKICSKCKRELPLESYNRGNSLYGRRSFCKECEKEVQNTPEKVARRRELELIRRQNPNYVKHRNNKDRERVHSNEISYKKSMLRSAKQRAINKNLDFNIDISDIVFPEKCPLLNIPMSIDSDNKDFSYSLDRIDSSKGYIKGNVWVISFKANRIKADATLEELELIAKNLKTYWIH